MKQCSVLVIGPGGQKSPIRLVLKRIGLVVHATGTWPDDEVLLAVEAVVVHVGIAQAAMVAARLRARAGFGRRVLIALVESAVSPKERRAAIASGLDDIMPTADAERSLGTRVLRLLRARPEYRCLLPPKDRRRSAA